MTAKDLDFYLFTRSALTKFQAVYSFVEQAQKLLNVKEVTFISIQNNGETRDEVFSVRKEKDIDLKLESGGIYISDKDHEAFELNVGRVGQFEYLSLSVAEEFLDGDSFVTDFITFVHDSCVQNKADFAFTYLAQPSGYDVSYLADEAALELGLRDMYWINVFGPVFTDLIGLEKLKHAPVYAAEELVPGTVSLITSPNPHSLAGKEELKSYVGYDYFLPNGETKRVDPVIKTGIFAVLKALVSIATSEDKESKKARLVPAFHQD